MARELHDGLGQVLGYIKMQTQATRSLLAQERRAEADNCLAQLAAVAQDAHADVREYIFEASAASPIELGFDASLRQYLDRFTQMHQIRTELEMPPEMTEGRFEPAVAVQLLRIIQEALTNARKHAHASQIWVSLAARDSTAEVTIDRRRPGVRSMIRLTAVGSGCVSCASAPRGSGAASKCAPRPARARLSWCGCR